ncbi:MAG: biopolymer transporter ExbD [Planctomycetes bacterium]|nr:biopolymer transporter ExbD [Planctomycetota bacterium]
MSLFPPKAGSRVKLSEMNMTPLIDCVFLLVLFFMVGMQFKQEDRQLEARLRAIGPTKDTEVPPPPVVELHVEILRGGTAPAPAPRLVVDGIPRRDWAAVEDYLRRYAQLSGVKSSVQVIVAPADNAVHAWVMKALDLLKQHGYEKVSFKR